MTIEEVRERIRPLDERAMEQAQQRWNSIAKPLHSLGVLEKIIIQIAGMTGSASVDIGKKALVTMCADNGVVEEGVTQSGQEVTAICAEQFVRGKTTACRMCDYCKADLFPVDVGMVVDTIVPKDLKVAYGTKNLTKEPAMTREQARQSVEAGITMAERLVQDGYRMLATGEMGIGNTTTSSAMAAVFLKEPVEVMTGRGAGLSSEGLQRKIAAIHKAIGMHQPDREDPLDVLSKVGGFDIGGMAGVYLGGAALGVPVVMDGFISCVAAVLAERLCPGCKDYMIASHVSKEPAARLLLDSLDKKAFIHGEMCLGEGTGAVASFPILDMAAMIYTTMGTFSDISIEDYQELV